MSKNKFINLSVGKSMRNFVLKVIGVTISIVVVAHFSMLFLAWLDQNVIQFQSLYISTEFQFIGTLICACIVLTIAFAVVFRRRKRELVTLTEHIQRVAQGDFTTRIPYAPKESLATVYSDFNKMIAELESVQILRNDFINNFSHEFKTPIASIQGFASLLLEKELSPEEERKYLEIIREESERLSRLTSNTILLSKLSSQEIIAKRETYDLGEQLRQCSIILSPQWLEKDLEFTGDFPEVSFCGNKELMQHMWLNVIGNAVKYTPPGGEVSVSLKQNEDSVEVRVIDSGKGMDEETLKHLFEPYFQGERSHSNQGLGLGLAIVKQILEHCNGQIQVKSKLNEGSEFVIRIPTTE